MINFRCWYCGRRYILPETRRGERMTCGCKSRIRVPRRSGRSSRAPSLTDRLIEFLVYGFGGGALGFGLGLLVFGRLPIGRMKFYLIAGLTVGGFLLGGIGGEPVINWIGRKIREREER